MRVCVCLCEKKPESAFRDTDGCISTQRELMFYFFTAVNLRGGFGYNYFRCSFVWSPQREEIVTCNSGSKWLLTRFSETFFKEGEVAVRGPVV